MIRVSKSERSARRDAKRNRQQQTTQTQLVVTLPTKPKKVYKKAIISHEQERLIEWFNDYYISERKKYVTQYVKKETGEVNYAERKMKLADWVLTRHVTKEETVAIFGGLSGSKFITFDIDFNEEDEVTMIHKSQRMAEIVISTLRNEFGLNDDEFLVSFSGSKGYHIDVFFSGDKLVSNANIRRFYDLMLKITEATASQIELRPTNLQAVKLPLSMNKKTNKKCAIVDKDYFNELEDESVFSIRKVDFARIEEQMEELEELFPELVIESAPSQRSDNEDNKLNDSINTGELDLVMQVGTLVEGGTRHKVTLAIATLFNTEGRKREDALDVIWSIIETTYNKHRGLLDKAKTLEDFRKETERIVNLAFDRNYRFGAKERKVLLTKEDILFITKAKTQKEREMLLIMLIHSKKYADEDGVFYLTHKQMANYGAAKDRSSTKKYYESLQAQGLIEIIQANNYSGRRKEVNGNMIAVKDPNMFALMYESESVTEDGFEVTTFNTRDFKEIITMFLSPDEIREALGSRTYYNHYSQLYK